MYSDLGYTKEMMIPLREQKRRREAAAKKDAKMTAIKRAVASTPRSPKTPTRLPTPRFQSPRWKNLAALTIKDENLVKERDYIMRERNLLVKNMAAANDVLQNINKAADKLMAKATGLGEIRAEAFCSGSPRIVAGCHRSEPGSPMSVVQGQCAPVVGCSGLQYRPSEHCHAQVVAQCHPVLAAAGQLRDEHVHLGAVYRRGPGEPSRDGRVTSSMPMTAWGVDRIPSDSSDWSPSTVTRGRYMPRQAGSSRSDEGMETMSSLGQEETEGHYEEGGR